MKIQIHDGDIHLLDLRTRLPFKYGIATMTSTPHAFVRLRLTVAGHAATGIAADSLPPKWFTKDPNRPIDEELAEILRVLEQALAAAAGMHGESPFAVWRQLYGVQANWGREQSLPPLLTHFGTALVERAMLDAVCRSLGKPFAEVLRSDRLGIRLAEIHPALRSYSPADLLPTQPLARALVRHTVGLADPLVEEDISAEERLQDGLPQSLAACIQTYKLRHFKIKVSGHLEHDQDRLARIAGVIEQYAPIPYMFSLDGNEQFHSAAEFETFWNALIRKPELGRFFLEHLAFIEQPFHRKEALDPAAMRGLPVWPALPPMIIDESDSELESLPRALNMGYAGTSHKNCKGVFKGIINACLLIQRRRSMPTRPALLSGEDLVNVGPVALLQDLMICANLGIQSVERNGHHYFAGLSQFPAEVQEQILRHHGDLYHASPAGWPTLTIQEGALALQSLLDAPFGVQPLFNVEQFSSAAAWRKSHGL